ncbi:MAG: apolipoprotein N-acyltransferase [Planctomycetia bacterium]|nr:apolipoprotein N-acyltransferase [Planctomycetia bacterium]
MSLSTDKHSIQTEKKDWSKTTFLPFFIAFFSFIAYWLALPPVSCWGLVFLVPAIWTFLLRNEKLNSFLKTQRTNQEIFPQNNVWSKGIAALFVRFVSWLASFYGQIWLATYLFWLLVAFWLTFPHPATSLGWLAVALVVSPYFPLFIALTRTFVYRWNFPIFLIAPIVWIGMEWFRKHLFGGFSFASLEHSLYQHPSLIQLAFPIGEYIVGAVIVLIGMGLGLSIRLPGDSWRRSDRKRNNLFKKESNFDDLIDSSEMVQLNDDQNEKERRIQSKCRISFFPLLVVILTVILILFWGKGQLDSFEKKYENCVAQHSSTQSKSSHFSAESTSAFRVALLQDGTTFSFPVSEDVNEAICQSYIKMTNEAAKKGAFKPDLIVWPESCFSDPFYLVSENGFFPGMESLSASDRNEQIGQILSERDQTLFDWVSNLKTPLVLGALTVEYNSNGQPNFYNSAWFVSPERMKLRNDKAHLVIFGEYLPFEEYLPDWFPLKTLCSTVKPGKASEMFFVKSSGRTDEIPILANICFESATPQFIFKQIEEVNHHNSCNPQILVNISNDGWFRHIWQIDYHLAANVFRAVENHIYVLSATHGGFSAAIDPTGKILNCGKRGKTEIVYANIYPELSANYDNIWAIYRLFPALCAFFCVLTGLIILRRKRSK